MKYYIVFKMSAEDIGFQTALEEAKTGAKEGGVPIGACLVDKDGNILGMGHNMRVQKDSAILHVCSFDYTVITTYFTSHNPLNTFILQSYHTT